ncbi:hypothetical protein PILCRDRAFT_310097 [Piloderma croceum F 1598]|uniref:MYND-type domain-containing protein n=1 Tax=Piloderma croceum (strain F 1598) TaxID=765440 RepID=A0A0C3BJV4_PILCF|nr:hypothetical protein PILCRDRAFT_310097 [Piloderma croceum F 1598]
MILIPRRSVSGHQNGLLPLYIVAEGEADTTITVLRRILRNNATISEFVGATASHLRRFRGFEAKNAAAILEKLWNWARSFRSDPLCSEFHRVVRTSAPLWSSLFDASSRSTDHPGSFIDTPQFYVINLANHLIITRDSSSEAIALTELWVSTGIFDAMEVSLREVARCGTEDEQVEFCGDLARIYHGISYGPQGNPAFTSLMQQQLPRPRTIRLLWDISLRLSGTDVNRVASSHACRIVVLALEQMFAIPNACNRRGCARISTARCTRCRLEYCGTECQKR